MLLSAQELLVQFWSLFLINLASLFVLTYFLFYKRHHDKQGFVTYTLFGIFLFTVVFFLIRNDAVISLGFAIFGILSLIRLRSDTFSKIEITYFFAAMSLSLINGMVADGHLMILIAINIVLLFLTYVFDNPVIFSHAESKVLYKLDAIPATLFNEPETTKEHLSTLLNVEVTDYTIVEIDSIKDSTHMRITYKS